MNHATAAAPPQRRVDRIRDILQARFSPLQIEVSDDSAAHAGHGGFDVEGSHFRVRMVATAFAGRSRLARHRLVYDALSPLLHREIHALVLDLRAPGE